MGAVTCCRFVKATSFGMVLSCFVLMLTHCQAIFRHGAVPRGAALRQTSWLGAQATGAVDHRSLTCWKGIGSDMCMYQSQIYCSSCFQEGPLSFAQ